MTDIRLINKRTEKAVAAYLGLSVPQLWAGIPLEQQNKKYIAIDVDTIIPRLDAAERERAAAIVEQLREAHEEWKRGRAERDEHIHKTSLQDKLPLCWVGEDKGEFNGTKKYHDVTCPDCTRIFKGLVN